MEPVLADKFANMGVLKPSFGSGFPSKGVKCLAINIGPQVLTRKAVVPIVVSSCRTDFSTWRNPVEFITTRVDFIKNKEFMIDEYFVDLIFQTFQRRLSLLFR